MSGNGSPTLPLTPATTFVVESSSGLIIPETRDGFYGYTDEKSLQQVRTCFPTDMHRTLIILNNQMEEQKWAQRRTSDVAHPQADNTLSNSFKLSSIREALQIQTTEELHPSPFSDDEDKEQVSDAQHHSSSLFDVSNLAPQGYMSLQWTP